ncbi:B-cell receptor CD22-like [Astyanax mexicanus]|uniref:B-cell receptor CD22 n=1 Tax=Astyanax mexicanus TaxID=7994 RepID=A0A8B9KCF4_ASTMX|nr:B-cell receptor CD22-like [Astyanax mexicanus]
MDAEWWLFFLLANLCSCSSQYEINIGEAEMLAADEGSCVTIDCIHTNTRTYMQLFWFKDAVYNNEKKEFEGTIVYSNTEDRPHTSGRRYAHRVQYQSNANYAKASCTLRINDLEKADSGNYSFRTIGSYRYMSKHVSLTVKDNPCKVHIESEDKKMLREGNNVSLWCSTSAQCSHHPEWYKVISERVSEPMEVITNPETQDEGWNKITELKLSVTWEDNGRSFSCRPAGSKDDCQARNITLEVEYKPRDTEVQNSPETVKEGDTVTLSCSSKAHPNASFTWYKYNLSIQSGSSEYKKYNINPADSGNYSCKATNDLGTDVSLPVRINVLYAPKDVRIKAETSDVKIGDTLHLTCSEQSSNPAPHVYSWYKDDELYRFGTGSLLTITELKQSHSGWYHCEAENRIKSTASKKIHISVQYAPMYTYITGSSQIKLRSTFILTCLTDANPPANHYSWYFKSEGTQQYFLLPQTTQSYQIEEVHIEDSGSYICNSKNIIGAGPNSTEFKFNVLYPPSQPNLTMVETIRDDEKLSISCTVKSYPAAEMTLSRITLQNPEDVLIIQDQTSTISFSGTVSEAHAGQYTCRAKNSEGQSHTTRELKVLYAPKDVQVLDVIGQNWKEGNNLELTCTAHSEPTVSTYTWEKSSGKEIQSKSEKVGGTQKLNIYNLTPADSGHYFCTAGNELGYRRSASFEIRVKYGPNITITHNLTSLNDWDGKAPVSLSCNVDCYPPVTNYQWFTNEENTILSYDQTYIVYPQKQGTYYCVAKNEVGESTSHPVKLWFKGLFQQIFLWILISVFFLCILIVVILLVHRIVLRTESSDGTDSQSFFIPAIRARFLTGSQNNTRENLVMEGEMEPYSHRHNQSSSTAHTYISANIQNHAGRSVPNIHTEYDAVKRPEAIQKDPAMSTVNYANLQIKNHNNPSKSVNSSCEAGTVYAVVSKKKQNTKVVPEVNDDYENVSSAHAPKTDFSNINWDSDTSEEEEKLNYSTVTFTATQQHKPRHTGEDSSSEEEERTQYSQVKIN